ncbi:MAG: hypothetical protein BYD32DRAFT_232298 [Podila humilis]|nr:MAG: hypothetical protein BYD32DRAFT_232298 [Podila humilis]
MDPTANNDRNSLNGDPDSKGKGKASTLSNANTSSLLGSIAGSAKSLATALNPTRPQSGYGTSSSLLGTSGRDAKQQAAFSSSASYQQATRALETMQSTSSSASGTSQPGFRSGPEAGGGVVGGDLTMDWDNFLSSSTLTDDKPYQPPSFSAIRSTTGASRPIFPTTSTTTEPTLIRSLPPDNVYQNHLSQPMNLTPANHAAFLEYLKSTVNSQISGPSTTISSPTTSPQQQPQPPISYQPYTPPYSSAQPLFSRDVQFQQHQDGGEVLAFLHSTNYSDFVDEVEAAGLEKHQQERRRFHYSAEMVSPSMFSALSLIQHLPSERQDIVQYLLQQGTYAADVYAQPFGTDGRDEAVSLHATLSEQEQFLRQRERGKGGEDATTEEMERVLAEIVADAKKEAATGTQGRALDRLLMVRSHITMGTKL